MMQAGHPTPVRRLVFLACLLTALLLAGCARQKTMVPVGKAPDNTPTAEQEKPKFSPKQLAGKWTANLAIDSRMPAKQRQAYETGMQNFELDLNANGTFAMTAKGGRATGTWLIAGKSLFVTLLKQGDKTVDQLVSEAEKKGASKEQVAGIKKPARFDISDDGKRLTSPTGNPQVLVILKRA